MYNVCRGNYSSIANSRDSTPLSAEAGKEVLKIFKEQPEKPNVFESFEYMDRREDYIRAQRDHNPEFEKYFEECCTAYKEDPERFQPQKRPYYTNKGGRRPTRSNFGYKKYSHNGNSYHNKNSYYKKNGDNWYNNKPADMQEQFVVKPEQNIDTNEKNSKQAEKFREQQEKRIPNRYYKSKENQVNHNRYQDENHNSSNLQSAQ